MHKWTKLIATETGGRGHIVDARDVLICGDYGVVNVVKPFARRCDATRAIAQEVPLLLSAAQ